MTRRDALWALERAVEAGLDTVHHHARAFPSESAQGHCTWHNSHKASNIGSLDAAKALHEVLLPGWAPSVGQNVHHGYWFAHVMRSENGAVSHDYSAQSDNPARAWLLAIIRALIAQEGGE
jgi:hypothetical protein